MDSKTYVFFFIFLVVLGISYGYINNPLGGLINLQNQTAKNMTVTATDATSEIPKADNAKWGYFLVVGLVVGYMLKKGTDSYVGKGVEEVEADVRKFAREHEGMRYVKILSIKEIAKGIWEIYFVNYSSINDTGGKHWMNAGYKVRYEGNRVKRFELAVYDPIQKQYVTQEEAASPKKWYETLFPKKQEEPKKEVREVPQQNYQPMKRERQIA